MSSNSILTATRALGLKSVPSVPQSAVTTVSSGTYLSCRYAAEFLGAALLLFLLSPIILLAYLLVRLTSRGPGFYSQVRVGRNGRHYNIYKLRSMTHNCEKATGAQWAASNDPRVTLVGRFLRASHIDEFPQLWNVLRGEMSLIGPRPERPEFVEKLKTQVARYEDRLAVRPGIAGLAQIHLPPDRDIEDVRRKVRCDLYYIRRVSLWLDIKILGCTALYLAGVPFRFSSRVLRLPSLERIEGHSAIARSGAHSKTISGLQTTITEAVRFFEKQEAV